MAEIIRPPVVFELQAASASQRMELKRSFCASAGVQYPALWWTPSTISGAVTSGTQATAFHPFLSIAAGTNGQARMAMNIGNGGPVWPGGDNVVNFDKRCIVQLRLVVQLSAHSSSQVAAHFTHANPTAHTSYSRSNKGFSIIWAGGASAGTVKLQAHNGTTTTDSATASYPINDVSGYNWSLEWEPGVAVRLYCDGVLKCTLTTGLPSGTQGGSSNGMVFLAGNTTSGTGNATFLRFVDGEFFEFI